MRKFVMPDRRGPDRARLTGTGHADDLKPIQYTFADGTAVRLSGWQRHDDFVDNDGSSNRARIPLFSNPNDD